MGITAAELKVGQKIAYADNTRTVEHIAMHPSGVWIRFTDGSGRSLTALNAFGAVFA